MQKKKTAVMTTCRPSEFSLTPASTFVESTPAGKPAFAAPVSFLMRAGRILLALTVLALFTAALQAFFYLKFRSAPPTPVNADLIAVFPGGYNRIPAGLELANGGWGRDFVVVDTMPTREVIEPILKKQGRMPPNVGLLTAGKSFTTFENALETVRLVQKHGYRSVLLVTSNYHMMRSNILLRIMLLGSGAKVHSYPVPEKVSLDEDERARHNLRMMIREMARFWVSLGEVALYATTGRHVRNIPSAPEVRRQLRNAFDKALSNL